MSRLHLASCSSSHLKGNKRKFSDYQISDSIILRKMGRVQTEPKIIMHGPHITLPLPIPLCPKEHLKLRSRMHIWTSNRRLSESIVLTKQRAIYSLHTWGGLKIGNHFLFLAIQKQNIRADIVFHLWVGRRRRERIPTYVFSRHQNNSHLS